MDKKTLLKFVIQSVITILTSLATALGVVAA